MHIYYVVQIDYELIGKSILKYFKKSFHTCYLCDSMFTILNINIPILYITISIYFIINW